MKWRSFDAVIPSEETLINEAIKKTRKKMPNLSEEQIQTIENNITNALATSTPINIIYYYNQEYFKIKCKIKKIDSITKKITLHNDTVIYFKQIIEVN